MIAKHSQIMKTSVGNNRRKESSVTTLVRYIVELYFAKLRYLDECAMVNKLVTKIASRHSWFPDVPVTIYVCIDK